MSALILSLLLTQAASSYSPEESRAIFAEGVEAYGRDDAASAEAAFKKLRDHGVGGADVEYNLGTAALAQGKLGEAETVLRKVVDVSVRVRSESHPDTLAAMTNLVSTLTRGGKVAEAEELGRKTFAIKTRVLGPEHAETVISQSSLGQLLCQQQKAEG